MNFAIVIEGDPRHDASFERAYGFARAAVASGHSIYRVFLYHEAVCVVAPEFEAAPGLIGEWVAFAREQGIELTACVSAAERRGILTGQGEVRDGIVIVGLGQFADCLLRADRTIHFRA